MLAPLFSLLTDFDKEIMPEMGQLGILGATIKGYHDNTEV